MPTYCRVFCGANKESIEELVTTGYVEVYGIGSNFSISREFVENLISVDVDLVDIRFDGIKTIEDEAFRYIKGDSTISLNLGDSLQYIGEYAFAQSNFLSKIIIPKSVITIGNGAFYACINLREVEFEVEGDDDPTSSLRTIGISAFQNNPALQYITRSSDPNYENTNLPTGLKNICAYAFAHCSLLSDPLVIPDTVEHIGPYAFAWTNFSEITLGRNLSTKSGNSQGNVYISEAQEVTLLSKRQFRYYHVTVSEEEPIVNNKITLPEEFKYCINENQLMIFKNHRHIPHGSVLSHPMDNTPLYQVDVFLNIPEEEIHNGDEFDIFYLPESMQNINDCVENFDSYTPPQYINEDEVLPYKCLPSNQNGFIIMSAPHYGNTNKDSLFIFINGRKLDRDSIYDISTTMMKITRYLQYPDPDTGVENKYPIEILSFADNDAINTMLYSKDGMSHSFDQQNIINLETLDSYNNLSILDKMLYELPISKLSTVFPEQCNILNEPPSVGVKYDRDYVVSLLYDTYKAVDDPDWSTRI